MRAPTPVFPLVCQALTAAALGLVLTTTFAGRVAAPTPASLRVATVGWPNPWATSIDRLTMAAQLTTGLTTENARKRWSTLKTIDLPLDQLGRFVEAWARLVGEDALTALENDAELEESDALLAAALSGVAHFDSEVAMSWLEQRPDNLVLGCGLIRGLASIDVDLATEYVRATWTEGLSPAYLREIATFRSTPDQQ